MGPAPKSGGEWKIGIGETGTLREGGELVGRILVLRPESLQFDDCVFPGFLS